MCSCVQVWIRYPESVDAVYSDGIEMCESTSKLLSYLDISASRLSPFTCRSSRVRERFIDAGPQTAVILASNGHATIPGNQTSSPLSPLTVAHLFHGVEEGVQHSLAVLPCRELHVADNVQRS